MKKLVASIVFAFVTSVFAFAAETNTTSNNNVTINTPPASASGVNQNGIPANFTPLTTSAQAGLIMPNQDTSGSRKLLLGGFVEIYYASQYWEWEEEKNNNNCLVAGGSLNFVANNTFSSYINIGALCDGRYVAGEFGIDGVVSSFSKYGYEGITRYSQTGPNVENTFSVRDDSYHCLISLGASALCFFPLKEDVMWAVTPRGNVTFTFATTRARAFSMYFKVSPGALLAFTEDKKPDVKFSLGLSFGVSFKVF